jgi:hypothetical protein
VSVYATHMLEGAGRSPKAGRKAIAKRQIIEPHKDHKQKETPTGFTRAV